MDMPIFFTVLSVLASLAFGWALRYLIING